MTKWAAILAGCVLSVMPVFASAVYMTDSDNEFGSLNLTTGVFTPISTTSPTIYGMGFTSGGTLYGTDNQNPSNVYTINPGTGTATLVGAAPPYSALGSTVGPNGLIYAVSDNSAFYTINPSTLATNTINASLGFANDGLAVFDNGQFYTDASTGTPSDLLEQVNPVTGAPTQIGVGLGFEAYAGTLVGNTLYAVGLAPGVIPVLETIDTTTGTGTLVADITGMGPDASPDAVAYSAVPEPGTCLLAGLGVLALAAFRLRRRRALAR